MLTQAIQKKSERVTGEKNVNCGDVEIYRTMQRNIELTNGKIKKSRSKKIPMSNT